MPPKSSKQKPADAPAAAVDTTDSTSASDSAEKHGAYEAPPEWAKVLIDGQQNILTRLTTFEQVFQTLQANQREMAERLDVFAERMVDQEARLEESQQKLGKMEKLCEALTLKVQDLENRSRRHNIRIFGLPEGVENGRPTEFVANLLPQLLGSDNFESPILIDRAHRTLRPRPADGDKPRAIIARIHLFHVKEKILRLRRQSQDLKFQGRTIHIFPDYSEAVARMRKQFSSLLRDLRTRKIQHSFQFPARLHIGTGDSRKTFTDVEEAKRYLQAEGERFTELGNQKHGAD